VLDGFEGFEGLLCDGVADFVGALFVVGCDGVGSVGVVSVFGGRVNDGGGVVGGADSSFERWTINHTKPITPRTATATPPTMLSLRCRSRCADRRRLCRSYFSRASRRRRSLVFATRYLRHHAGLA
jgi:hypothetical protein